MPVQQATTLVAMPMMMTGFRTASFESAPLRSPNRESAELSCEGSHARIDALERDMIQVRRRLDEVQDAVALQKDILLEIRKHVTPKVDVPPAPSEK
jgi:hypothetical protein